MKISSKSKKKIDTTQSDINEISNESYNEKPKRKYVKKYIKKQKIVKTVEIKKTPIRENPFFIMNKFNRDNDANDYYVDDNNIIWNSHFEIVGVYKKDPVLFMEMNVNVKVILDRMDGFIKCYL